MGFFRKKLDRIASGVKADPTESPLFGAFVGGTLVHDIEQTGLTSWARARPGAVGLKQRKRTIRMLGGPGESWLGPDTRSGSRSTSPSPLTRGPQRRRRPRGSGPHERDSDLPPA